MLRSHIKHGKKSGQICLDDDVLTEDEPELKALKKVIEQLFEGLLPESSSFEKQLPFLLRVGTFGQGKG